MKYSLAFFLWFVSVPALLFAQQKVEGGVFVGASNYQGDLAEDQIEIGETKLAYGALIRYFMSQNVHVKGQFTYATISGSDANSPHLESRAWSFTGVIVEASITAEWLIFGKNRYNNAGIFVSQFNPYLFGGVGIAFVNSNVSFGNPDSRPDLFPEPENTNNFIVVPFGAGLRFDASEHLSLALELGWRNTFSDYIDDISINGKPEKNDWYTIGGLSIAYVFGGTDPFRF